MIRKNIITLVAGCLFFCNCVKDDICYTDHPDHARVTLMADWNNRGAGVDKPDSYTVETTGVTETAAADTHTLDKLLDPRDCRFYI